MGNLQQWGLITLTLLLIGCGGSGGSSPTNSDAPPALATAEPIASPASTGSPTAAPISTSAPLPIGDVTLSRVFPGSILLGKPTNNSITLSIVTEKDTVLGVAYGQSATSYSDFSPSYQSLAGIPLEITLSGLSADTEFYYQVIYQESGSDTLYAYMQAHFSTQKASTSPFNFAIHADAHIGIRLRGPDKEEKADDNHYKKTLINTLAFNPDFLLDLGDTFMSEKNAQRDFFDMTDALVPTPPLQMWVEEDYVFVRSFFNEIGSSVPLYLVNGNHEGETGWSKNEQESVAVWANNLRKELFPAVSANDFYSGSSVQEPYVGSHDGYYAWTWGGVLFVVLDPFWYADSKPKVDNEWAWTLGKEQYDWLAETLENSDARFKFVFLHNLVGGLNGSDGIGSGRGGALQAGLWEWGGTDGNTGLYAFDEQRPGWGKPIHNVLVDGGVDIVFHGHDHVFVREDHPDGIIYQAMPQPSILKDTLARATKRASISGYDPDAGVVLGGSGFLNVEVGATMATVSFVRTIENELTFEQCKLQTCYEILYSYDITAGE